jgi:transcriptional regulator with XRE-family HTH domain
MPDPSLGVGDRLLKLRQVRGLSLRALAADSGLSVNAINRIERGESSPTVSSLQRLAAALDVALSEFFKLEPEHATILVRGDEGLRSRTEGVLVESLGAGLPGQHLGPFLMTLDAGASSAEEAIQHGGEEFVHCLSGEVDYLVGDEWHRLREGDSLLFLANQPHLGRNPSRESARLLIVILAPAEEIHATQQRHLMRAEG